MRESSSGNFLGHPLVSLVVERNRQKDKVCGFSRKKVHIDQLCGKLQVRHTFIHDFDVAKDFIESKKLIEKLRIVLFIKDNQGNDVIWRRKTGKCEFSFFIKNQ